MAAIPSCTAKQCDLKELMQEAIHYAHRRLGEKNVTAIIDCERSFPPLWVDRRQIREAFTQPDQQRHRCRPARWPC